MSPFLFIIMAKDLGRSISALQMEDRWKGIKVANGIKNSTHLQFADNTILFGEANIREAKIIKICLDDYYKASG